MEKIISVKPKRNLYYLKHKEEILAKTKLYYQSHKTQMCAAKRLWYEQHKEYLLTKKLGIKIEVLTHYGKGKCACNECGFEDIRALTIDHIDGGGYQHRKGQSIIRGCYFYRILKRQGYPNGYQTLCMNCQFIKRQERKEWKR